MLKYRIILLLLLAADGAHGQNGWLNHLTGGSEDLYGIDNYSSSSWTTVGQSGAIYQTINSGATWTPQVSTTQMPLHDVFTPSSTVAYAVGDSGIILKTVNSGATWVRQTSGTYMPIKSVYFSSVTTGFACGYAGYFLSTTNGGATWNLQQVSLTANFNDMYFASATTAYCVGWAGVIYKTTDGGATWQQQNSGVTQNLEEVHFLDTLTGFCSGGGGTLLRTIDGGANWIPVSTFTSDNILSLCFLSPALAFCGTAGGDIFFSSNGGLNWLLMPCLGTAVHEIVALNSSSAIASCDMGNVQESVFLDWVGMPGTAGCNQAFFLNDSLGYAISSLNSQVLKTTDGTNWSVVYTASGFQHLFFVNDSVGYISGANTLYRTMNGGVTWTTVPVSYIERMQFFSNDTGYAQANGFQKTTDGGQTWITVGTQTSVIDFQFFDPDTGFSLQSGHVYMTMDGGVNWSEMFSVASTSRLFFANKNTGFTWNASSVYKTTDGGRNFYPLPVPALASGVIKDIFFVDSLTGYLSAGNSTALIYKTTDGGMTWSGQSREYNNPGTMKFFFPDKNHGYVCSSPGIMRNLNTDVVIGNDPPYQHDVSVRQPAPPYEWFAQPGDPPYYQNINTLNADFTATAVDHSGNVLLGAAFYDRTQLDTFTVDSPLNNRGLYLCKMDSGKNVIWLKPFFGSGTLMSMITSIETDAQNNIFMAGKVNGTMTFGNFTVTGQEQGFTAKLDPAGNVLWVVDYTLQQDAYEYVHELSVDQAGNVFITGYYNNSFSIGSFTLTNSGNCFVGKLDTQGNVQWLIQNTDAMNTRGFSCAASPDGGVFVCGSYDNVCMFGNQTLNTADGKDMFVAKFDASGNPVWLRTAYGNNPDKAADIACDNAGNAYVTGAFAEILLFSPTVALSTNGFEGIFYAKYSSTGNLLWKRKVLAGSGTAIAADSSGNCYVTGTISMNSFFADTLIDPAGVNEIFVIKADTYGRINWVKRLGGTAYMTNAYNVPRDISVDSSGVCYIAGDALGYDMDTTGTYQSVIVNASQVPFGYLAKIRSGMQTTVGEYGEPFLSDELGLLLYPVPAGDVLYFSMNAVNAESCEVTLFDLHGNLLQYMVTQGDGVHALNTKELSSGTYFLRVTGDKGISIKPFVVTH